MEGKPPKRSAGQIAVEFVIVYAVVLLVFVLLFGIVVSQRAATLSAQQYASMQLVTQDITGYIDQALIAGTGYNATLAIPASSNLQPYNLFVSTEGAVIANETLGKTDIRATSYSSARRLVVNGTQASSYNGVTLYNIPTYSGQISISNVGGTIYIDVPTAGLAAYAQSLSAKGVSETKAFDFLNTSVHGVVVAQSPSLNKAWDGGSWTINTWFMDTNPPQTSTGRDLIEESNGCTTGMWLQNTSATHYSLNTIQWYSSGGVCTNDGAVGITSGPIPYNTWVMGTSTFNYNGAGGGYVEICVDAQCSNTPWTSTSPSNYSKYGYSFLINDNDCCGGWLIGGELANVQLYSSALTQNQIDRLYAEGISGAPVNASSIEGWWPLNGNANDYSGNGNNGVQAYVLNYSNVAQGNVHVGSGSSAGSYNAIVGAAPSVGSASVIGKAFAASPVTNADGNATVFVTSNTTAGKVNVTINAYNYNTSLQSSLVGWWPLDEGYGNVTHDMSGNGNNGAFTNPAWAPFSGGAAFRAAEFNGAGAGMYLGNTGSYVNTTSSSVLKPQHMTVGAWVKAYSDTPWMLVSGGDTGGSWGSYYLSMTGDTSGRMTFGTYNNSIAVRANSTPIGLGKWYYVVGTYNGTNASIYIDGKLSGSVPDTQLVYYPPSGLFRIGNLHGFDDWNGTISNVQVYDTALSAQQISQQYAKGITSVPLSSAGLVGWWPLDGNINDYSAYASADTSNSIAFGNMQAGTAPSGLPPVASFNGANNYISANVPSLPTGSSARSMSVWVKAAAPAGGTYHAIVGWSSVAGTRNTFVLYQDNNNIFKLITYNDDHEFGGPLVTGKWYNVVLTYQSGATFVDAYIDGLPAGPQSRGGPRAPSKHNLSIGKSPYESTYFNGSVADLQVYDAALTPQQVQQLYAQGLPLYDRVNVSLS